MDDRRRACAAGQETPAEAEAGGVVQVPANIDFVLHSSVKKVLYDNLTLTDLTGDVIVRNEEVELRNLRFNTLQGTMNLTGHYNAKDTLKPLFDMDMESRKLRYSGGICGL